VFDRNVECDHALGFFPNKKLRENVARFRQINLDNPYEHHDALEFPSGQVVLLTRLCAGQHATVLQLPAGAHPAEGTQHGEVASRNRRRAPRQLARGRVCGAVSPWKRPKTARA
jgi:hypothetical protein